MPVPCNGSDKAVHSLDAGEALDMWPLREAMFRGGKVEASARLCYS